MGFEGVFVFFFQNLCFFNKFSHIVIAYLMLTSKHRKFQYSYAQSVSIISLHDIDSLNAFTSNFAANTRNTREDNVP